MMQNVGCIASIISKVVTLEHFKYTFSVHFDFTIEAELFITFFTLVCFLNCFTNVAFFVFFNIIKGINNNLFTYVVNCLILSNFLYSMKINTSLISPVSTGLGMSSFTFVISTPSSFKMIFTDFIRFVLEETTFLLFAEASIEIFAGYFFDSIL